MTKYARIKDSRAIDVWRVPEDFGTIELLNRCLPGGGFIIVPDDTMSGATDNGDGTYTNPPAIPAPTHPIVYKWDAFNRYLINKLDPNGRAKLQALLEAARDFVGVDNTAKNTRSFYTWYVGTTEFEKTETAEMLQILVDATIITSGQRTAVLNTWAEKPGL